MTPRETENNAYAKFWGDKQRALWYVMVFSVVVNYGNQSQFQFVNSLVVLLVLEHSIAERSIVFISPVLDPLSKFCSSPFCRRQDQNQTPDK